MSFSVLRLRLVICMFLLTIPLTIIAPATGRAEESQARTWALAASALIFERNGDRHDLLGGRLPTEEGIEKQKRSLGNSWGVNNRQDLLEVLKWLESEGHRREFDEMGKAISAMNDVDFNALMAQLDANPEDKHRVGLVRDNFTQLGEKSIKGWDYVRFLSLCRWGYYCRYITDDEAWDLMMPVAGLIQRTFVSWEDLGANYLIGRQFWSLEQTVKGGKKYEEANRRLLDDPSSPWNQIPWGASLED